MTENKIVSIEEIDRYIERNKYHTDSRIIAICEVYKMWKSSHLAMLEKINRELIIDILREDVTVDTETNMKFIDIDNVIKKIKQSLGGGQ